MSKSTDAIILIPARLAAQRLPRKPLAEIAGEAMIVHIARRAEAAGIAPVYVAAGDSEIVEAVEKAGFNAILTDPALPSGSDRCVAALKALGGEQDIVINLQGDMPNIAADSIRAVYEALVEGDADCATLVHKCSEAQCQDSNQVKAVLALDGQVKHPRCLYFSRAPIPYNSKDIWGHIGLYAWRTASLLEFASLPPSPLEEKEKLEQLRALENGMIITTAKTTSPPISVDSPEDLARARKEMS